jgi:apolipoprotein D and lipocalin family protein
MKSFFSRVAMLAGLLLSGCASRPPLATVPSVDLARYSGKWYEIAKYPNFFQRGCVGQATAEYSANPDGSIRVVNRCAGKDGRTVGVEGRATVVPGSGNAKLRVNFGGPFGGAYWVIGLDETDYTWAVVGHPSRKFLWILARTPELPDATYRRILELVTASGYDVARLRKSAAK